MNDLVLSLNNGFHRHGWQGATLLGSVRGVSPAEAIFTPKPLKHGIWGLILHAAYWKYAVCLRIAKAGVAIRGVPINAAGDFIFPRAPSNHPDPPAKPSLKAWRDDIQLLTDFHEALIDAVSRCSHKQLDAIPPGGKSWTLRPIIVGAAAHDAYHCGQIQVIKKLIRRK